MLDKLPVIAPAAIAIIFLLIICCMGYVKAPPDVAYIISSYGWDMETIQSDAFPGLLAEAVFETDIVSHKQKGGYTSFEKAAADICRWIGVPMSLFL